MPSSRKQRERGRGVALVGGFAEHAASHGHNRVGGKHDILGRSLSRHGLGRRETERALTRKLSGVGEFVDVGGPDGVGHDADLGEQGLSPRTGGAEDQLRRGTA